MNERKEPVSVGASRRVKYIVLLVTLCVLVCVTVIGIGWPPQLFYWSEFRTGNVLVSRIESFKRSHGYLPGNLAEVGIKNEDSLNVYYQREGDDHYVVWFGTTLGESITYDSQRRDWR